MSRGITRVARPVAVWLGVSASAATATASVPGAWRDAAASVGVDRTSGLLVAGCASVLALALAWLWLITTATLRDVLRGTAPDARSATRRLVLLACGMAVAAGATVPAHADGAGAELLVGLPLPERAVAPAAGDRPGADGPAVQPAAARVVPASGRYVVRPGDSLWSIAVEHPGAGSTDSRWRAIWAANRTEVGDDPDLIHPGQVLRLPSTEQDGAR